MNREIIINMAVQMNKQMASHVDVYAQIYL